MAEKHASDPAVHASGLTEWTHCPQCGALAEIRRRTVLSSTAGPIEHVGMICVARHSFLLPVAVLDQTPGVGATSLP